MNSSPIFPAGRLAKTFTFPTFVLLAWLVCLTAPLKAQYAGNYSGTAGGDVDGVWSMTISAAGSISGRIVEEDEGLIYPVSGAVNASGIFTLVVSGFPSASFGGTINSSGFVNGSWSDPSLGASGYFDGNRLPAGISPYAGSYSGTATGDLTGTWTATVSSVGNWDGTGVTSGGNRYRIAGIVGATGYVDVCIQEGGYMRGQIDSSGNVEGEWYDFWDGGRFQGARNGPEIAVEQPEGSNITDGGTVDFGSVGIGSSLPLTFTIRNTGNANLTSLAITKNGTHAANFTVSALGATTLAPGISTTFTVTFTPSASGSRTAAIHIASNDADENPFDINLTGSGTAPSLAPGELVAPQIALTGGNVNLTVQPSVVGRSYQLQVSETMAAGSWQDLGAIRVGDGNNLVFSVPYVAAVRQRFYRLVLVGVATVGPAPEGFALIPAGSFQMGDQSNPLVGYSDELPVHTVQVSAFYMGKYEVTKEVWDTVRTWGLANGYPDLAEGSGKAANHSVHMISWYDMVKWCNARSEKEGLTPCYTVSGATYKTGSSTPVCNWSANGYRLPTEAEWEKAARGGLSGQNFPWGNTISHNLANFWNTGSETYQAGTIGPHPVWSNNHNGVHLYSSPVGSFAPNGYGLYDMAGNMWEWCWNWDGSYPSTSQTDPRGPASGMDRVVRGGDRDSNANYCRVALRGYFPPNGKGDVGFRINRSSVP